MSTSALIIVSTKEMDKTPIYIYKHWDGTKEKIESYFPKAKLLAKDYWDRQDAAAALVAVMKETPGDVYILDTITAVVYNPMPTYTFILVDDWKLIQKDERE